MKISELSYRPNCYLAFVLDEASREKLLRVCPPSFSKTVCHHATIAFNVDEPTLQEFVKDHENRDPLVEATGILIGDNIEAIAVDFDGSPKRKYSGSGGFYHVTLSLDPPTKPAASNDLFSDPKVKKIDFHRPIPLRGDYQLLK